MDILAVAGGKEGVFDKIKQEDKETD